MSGRLGLVLLTVGTLAIMGCAADGVVTPPPHEDEITTAKDSSKRKTPTPEGMPSGDRGTAPPPLASSPPPSPATPTTPTTPTQPTPTRPENGVFVARSVKLASHAFGPLSPEGKPCYSTFFSDVEARAVVDSDNRVVSLTVSATSNEKALTSCNANPYTPKPHAYSFETANPSAGPVALAGSTSNSPVAALTGNVKMATPFSGTLTLHWHRTDLDAPYDWEFVEQLELMRR